MDKIWTCKDGREIKIRDMDDRHLANTIRFLEKSHAVALNSDPPMFQGEMAQFFADIEYSALMHSGVQDLFPIYDDLVEEQERRRR